MIMAVVKNLMVRAGADFSGMKKEMDKASKNLKGFKDDTSKVMKDVTSSLTPFKAGMKTALAGIGAALAALGLGTIVKDAVKSAMDVEAAMQQINRTMGSSAAAFMEWANNGSKAFNMGKSD